MDEQSKKQFDDFVNEREAELFMTAKFRGIGKEEDIAFQSLVFLQQARNRLVLANTVLRDDDTLGELSETIKETIDKITEHEDWIRGKQELRGASGIDKVHRIEVVATAKIGVRSFFELRFFDREEQRILSKIVNCAPLKELGVMKRVSASKAETWLNTDEGKRWAFDAPHCSFNYGAGT